MMLIGSVQRRHCAMRLRLIGGRAMGGASPIAFWRAAGLVAQEANADLFAIEPDALAAPVGAAGRRQDEEEFAGVDPVDRPVDGQLGADLGDVADAALALPGSIDRHD